MLSDYEGKLLHEARIKELMHEAEGGWRIKAAQAARDARPASMRRVRTFIGALSAAIIGLLVVATAAMLISA